MCERVYAASSGGIETIDANEFSSIHKICRLSANNIAESKVSKTNLQTKEFINLNVLMPLIQKISVEKSQLSVSNRQSHSNEKASHSVIVDDLKASVFSIYYLLTKEGIISDFKSGNANKQEILFLNDEISTVFKKRQEETQKAIEAEKTANRWDVASQFFSWFGALMGIITGIGLLAMGVYAVAGAVLLVGGLIQLTSQIMQLTGAWEQIKSILPGEDENKKHAVINWMQIGIAVLALVLAGVGAVYGGYSAVSAAFSNAQFMIGGVASIGGGIVAVGQGISNQKFENKKANIKVQDIRLTMLKNHRQDLTEYSESQVEMMEHLLKGFTQVLDYLSEMFRISQIGIRG